MMDWLSENIRKSDDIKPNTVKEVFVFDPPCNRCMHWQPRRINMEGFPLLNGFRFCWAKEMQSDFSCFQREEKKGE